MKRYRFNALSTVVLEFDCEADSYEKAVKLAKRRISWNRTDSTVGYDDLDLIEINKVHKVFCEYPVDSNKWDEITQLRSKFVRIRESAWTVGSIVAGYLIAVYTR